jgi:hypothetical protein
MWNGTAKTSALLATYPRPAGGDRQKAILEVSLKVVA